MGVMRAYAMHASIGNFLSIRREAHAASNKTASVKLSAICISAIIFGTYMRELC